METPLKILPSGLLDELAAKAAASPRGRAHFNVHAGADDPVQRFFVAANRDSYFRPHRHLARSEMTLVLRGRFDLLLFDDTGSFRSRHSAGGHSGNLGFEVPRATWHTLLALEDGSAFLEVKQGPYDPATAAEFAPWAPAEGDAAVPEFQEYLRRC